MVLCACSHARQLHVLCQFVSTKLCWMCSTAAYAAVEPSESYACGAVPAIDGLLWNWVDFDMSASCHVSLRSVSLRCVLCCRDYAQSERAEAVLIAAWSMHLASSAVAEQRGVEECSKKLRFVNTDSESAL